MTDSFDIAGFSVSLEGDQATFRLTPRHDFDDEPSADLKQCLTPEFGPGGRLAGKHVVVALEDVPALSSRQLGALMSVQRATGTGKKLTVRGARRNIRELFKLTKMTELFDY
ncbi:MAG: STAS domain-containing protein [Phycisphaerae bacterium]